MYYRMQLVLASDSNYLCVTFQLVIKVSYTLLFHHVCKYRYSVFGLPRTTFHFMFKSKVFAKSATITVIKREMLCEHSFKLSAGSLLLQPFSVTSIEKTTLASIMHHTELLCELNALNGIDQLPLELINFACHESNCV